MLFRTVCGPELESIYRFVCESSSHGDGVSREEVRCAFVPRRDGGTLGSTQNVDDALLFLRSTGLIQGGGSFNASAMEQDTPFRLHLLRALRRIERGDQAPSHPVDPLYSLLLDEMFIKPDHLFVADLHSQANELCPVKEVGGLSREKTQAWQRVMSFLGVGRRVAGGFQCVYATDLVMDVVRAWSDKRGTIQAFCEGHLGTYLPFARQQDGDIAAALQAPLEHLNRHGDLELFPLQDSPSKPYFSERRLRGIRVQERGGNDD